VTRQTVLLVFHDVLLVEIEQAGAVAPHVRGRLHDGEWMSHRSRVNRGSCSADHPTELPSEEAQRRLGDRGAPAGRDGPIHRTERAGAIPGGTRS
jgi:hypothetical protein